jgi:UDP-3-O-[3-hydroxymyristoyl] glucosamine N-acyltransferase
MSMITAGELAGLLNAELVGDASLELVSVSKIEEAACDEITFIANKAYIKHLGNTQAGAVILDHIPVGEEGKRTYLITSEPYRAFLATLNHFHPEIERPAPGIHPTATVAEDVVVGDGVTVGPMCVIESGVSVGSGTVLRAQCFIGRGTKIGDDCLFHSRVSVRELCDIGNRVIIQDGAVIGSDGFGFAPGEEGYTKIPQVGNVILEDDVEVGANTTIDRATLGRTIVRRGVKLDNLVQIAHNVEIGENTVFAAQVGIAGSSKVGARSMYGGQVGMAGHIRMSDGVMVAAQSGVSKDHGPNKVIGGTPAQDMREWQRSVAAIRKLPEILKRLRKLEGGSE